MGIIKNYHDKKWTLQFLDALYNSIDIDKKRDIERDQHGIAGMRGFVFQK
jgi:hypothetical protein